MNLNKFQIGEKVKFINEPDTEAGKIKAISFNGKEWIYKFTSKEVDHAKKEIIKGFRTGLESELVLVEGEQ